MKLFCFISSVLFLANIPLMGYAANVSISQTIEAGELTIVDMPTDINLPRMKVSEKESLNFAIPKIPDPNVKEDVANEVVVEGASEKILVRDLRYDGGFKVQVEVSEMDNIDGPGVIPVGDIGILTFHRQGGIKRQARVSAGGRQVEAPLSGDPKKAEDYLLFQEREETPGISVPVTVLDGSIPVGEGRIGEWEIYPAFMLKLPAGLPVGKYVGSVTYTFS